MPKPLAIRGDFGYIPRAGSGATTRSNGLSNTFRFSLSSPMVRIAAGGAVLALAAIWGHGAAIAEDDFPLTGSYTQNVPCKGDGTDPAAVKVKISPQEIVSNVGVCTILNTKTEGNTLTAHVECKLASGPLMGDISFTPRPDQTIDFVDRDGNYKAILHRCPN